MSESDPYVITGPELASTLKLLDYPVKYPKWALCEAIPEEVSKDWPRPPERSTSPTAPELRTRPLSLQTLASIQIVAHSDGSSLQR